MNMVIWLVVGGLVAWAASRVMRTDGQPGTLLSVIVGVLGAALGGWFLTPLMGMSSVDHSEFSVSSLLISLLAAILLLAIVNLIAAKRHRMLSKWPRYRETFGARR
jgi:uncharacterized membrane protein YeaQ/YmgE (transglycosylase-associated protein family)